MIRRTLVIGLLTLLALGVGLPGLVGLYLARHFEQRVERLDSAAAFRVVSSRFERGWFGSRASLRIAVDGALCAAPPCASLALTSHIGHGPLVFGAVGGGATAFRLALGVADTRIELTDLWPRLIFEPVLPAAHIVTRVGFDGQSLSSLRMGGASVAVSRQGPVAHIDMDAVSGELAQPLGGDLTARVVSPAFRLVGARDGQLVWRGLRLHRSRLEADSADAATRLDIASLNLANGAGAAGRTTALEARWHPVDSQSTVAEPVVGGDFDIRAAELAFDNSQLGPIVIEGGVRRLDMASASALVQALAGVYETQGVGNEDARAVIYDRILPNLLAQAASVGIRRLHMVTANGDVEGHLRIAAPEQLRPAALLADVIAQLEVDIELRMPASIARDVAAQAMTVDRSSPYARAPVDVDAALAELVADGLIEKMPADNAYRFALTVHNGRLRLNGRNQIGWQSVVDQFETARERL